jgi:hypothetical protein
MSKHAFAAAVLGAGLCWGDATAFAGESEWIAHMGAGTEANQRGDFQVAGARFEEAMKEAQAFEERDPRLAQTLDRLAEAYLMQGRNADAEPLIRRSLAIREKAQGGEPPNAASAGAAALPVVSSAPSIPGDSDPGPPPQAEGVLDGALGGVKRIFKGIIKAVPALPGLPSN